MTSYTELVSLCMQYAEGKELEQLVSDMLKFTRGQVERVTQEFGIYTGATTNPMFEKGIQSTLDMVRNEKLKILAELTKPND